jgi:hypothetical protein
VAGFKSESVAGLRRNSHVEAGALVDLFEATRAASSDSSSAARDWSAAIETVDDAVLAVLLVAAADGTIALISGGTEAASADAPKNGLAVSRAIAKAIPLRFDIYSKYTSQLYRGLSALINILV